MCLPVGLLSQGFLKGFSGWFAKNTSNTHILGNVEQVPKMLQQQVSKYNGDVLLHTFNIAVMDTF